MLSLQLWGVLQLFLNRLTDLAVSVSPNIKTYFPSNPRVLPQPLFEVVAAGRSGRDINLFLLKLLLLLVFIAEKLHCHSKPYQA